MSDYDYSGSSVTRLPFPEFTQDKAGNYRREWKLVFTRPPDLRALEGILTRNSSVELTFTCEVDGSAVRLEVTSRQHAGSDAVMFATGRLLGELERGVGPVTAIEGLAREKWTYFRW